MRFKQAIHVLFTLALGLFAYASLHQYLIQRTIRDPDQIGFATLFLLGAGGACAGFVASAVHIVQRWPRLDERPKPSWFFLLTVVIIITLSWMLGFET